VTQLALSQFGAPSNAVGDMLCVRVLQAVNLRPTATSTTVNPLARVCLQLPGPGCVELYSSSIAVVTTTIRLRFDGRSTAYQRSL